MQGESTIDYFSERGRVRGSVLFALARPERVRFDVFSPFGVTLSTLTSDAREIALLDVGAKQFLRGPAVECGLARFLEVPLPPHALVDLLAGMAPVLVHRPEEATLTWSSGAYRLAIAGQHAATETIDFLPHPDDWGRPWSEQRVRVLAVRVSQGGVELYRAELSGFAPVRMATARVDPEGLEPDLPPSGPRCSAELPWRLRLRSEVLAQDLLIVHRELAHNPPLASGIFRQAPPPGVRTRTLVCPSPRATAALAQLPAEPVAGD
jgi:hypothetical protein